MIDLRLGDCLEVMAGMEADSVDAVITDPPYGMGKAFSGDALRRDDLGRYLAPIFQEAVRVLRPGGAIACFAPTKWDVFFAEWWIQAGADYLRSLRLYKPNDCTYPWAGWLLKSEAILLLEKPGGRSVVRSLCAFAALVPGQLDIYGDEHWARSPAITFTHDVYTFNHAGGELPKGTEHPSVKPLAVVTDLVSKLCPVDGMVLDPFMGTGTTAVACARSGRRFIGAEIEPAYWHIATSRVDASKDLQGVLV